MQVIMSGCGYDVRLGEVVVIKEWRYIPPSRQLSLTTTCQSVMCDSCGYVAKRSSGYLEVVDMERLASDVDPTASANLSPDKIFSVTSLKDSIRCVM